MPGIVVVDDTSEKELTGNGLHRDLDKNEKSDLLTKSGQESKSETMGNGASGGSNPDHSSSEKVANHTNGIQEIESGPSGYSEISGPEVSNSKEESGNGVGNSEDLNGENVDMTDILSVIDKNDNTSNVVSNGETSTNNDIPNGDIKLMDAVKDASHGDVEVIGIDEDVPIDDVKVVDVDADLQSGIKLVDPVKDAPNEVEVVEVDEDVPNGDVEVVVVDNAVPNGDKKVVEVIDLTTKEETKKPSKLLGKFNDIRNFFYKLAAPSSSSSNKRKSELEDEPPAKKSHLDRKADDKEDSDSSTDKQLSELSQLSDIKAKQPVDTTTADVSRGTDKFELTATLMDEDLPKSFKRRKVKILIHRLEETEHCNEALKQELKKLKELKKQESAEYEVEAVLDYAWCKETSRGLYYVKWVGWEDQQTWEPLENLKACSEALRTFYVKRLAEREAAQPGRKRFLEVPPDPRTCFERRSEYINKICAPPCQSELETFFKKIQESPIKMWPETVFNTAVEKLQKSKKVNEDKIKQVKEQIMLRHVRDKRRDQLQRLKDWEVEINADSADSALLKVENDFDLEGPPRHMTYINKYMPTPGIIIPDDPPMGCECKGGECGLSTEKTCCPSMNGQFFNYTKYGKLRITVGTPIFECNKRCKCGPKCGNRVVQRGRKVKLSIYRTSNGCGWGVKTLENIKEGAFVVEYVGEVITSEEAEQRGKKYDAEGKTYLFDLDFNLGENNLYTVDAALYGNVAHFINHSCEPNLAIYNVWIDCLDPNLPRLCFFAARDIAKGEQITFDYRQQPGHEDSMSSENESVDLLNGETSKSGDEEKPSEATTSTSTAAQTECRCGAPTCRKIIF